MYGKMLRLRYYRECEKEEDSVYMTRELHIHEVLVKDKNLVTCLCIFCKVKFKPLAILNVCICVSSIFLKER